jgi:hypothetical protein
MAKTKKKFEPVSKTATKDGVKYGCSIGKDDDGYFAYTHRCRSKSYSNKDKIPKNVLKFIDSTS